MHATREDRTDAGVRSTVSSGSSSLGAWIGDLMGEVEGVIAVYHARDRETGLHRVWTIPESAADGGLAGAIREREALVGRKFGEFKFEFKTTVDARPPEKGAALVFRKV